MGRWYWKCQRYSDSSLKQSRLSTEGRMVVKKRPKTYQRSLWTTPSTKRSERWESFKTTLFCLFFHFHMFSKMKRCTKTSSFEINILNILWRKIYITYWIGQIIFLNYYLAHQIQQPFLKLSNRISSMFWLFRSIFTSLICFLIFFLSNTIWKVKSKRFVVSKLMIGSITG